MNYGKLGMKQVEMKGLNDKNIIITSVFAFTTMVIFAVTNYLYTRKNQSVFTAN